MQLALFPLRLVVFPFEKINLHIFEERYKQLIKECSLENKPFGIPSYIDGRVMPIGTQVLTAEIVKEYPGGEMDIKCEAQSLFEIKNYYGPVADKLYDSGDVQPYPIENDAQTDKLVMLIELVNELFRRLQVKEVSYDTDTENLPFLLGHMLGLSLSQQYELIRFRKDSARVDFLISYLKQLEPKKKIEEVILRSINVNGHFKNIIPPK